MSATHYGTTACLRGFAQVCTSLPVATLSISSQLQLDSVEDEFGRFRVWAANIGALQKGHSSLDYRLREAPLVKDNVQKLLKELHECLQEINVVLTGTRIPYDRQQRPTTPESDKSFSSNDSDSSSHECAVPEPRLTELEQRFLTVVDIVDNLYKFSRMVRTPALHTRFLKAASYKKIDRDTGIDLISQFKAVDNSFVREGFLSFRREAGISDPQIDLEDAHLIKRFGNAITKRRQQFLYWKRHRDKLGVHARTEDFELSTVLVLETVISEKRVSQTEPAPALPSKVSMEKQKEIALQPAESSIGKTALTATSATIFIPTDHVSDDGNTTTSFATTARGIDGAKVDLPALPKSAVTGKDFECQYCFAIVPSRYQSARGWRTHILRDLKPYICTYPGCSQPDLLFSSRQEWLDHEAWEHRKKIACPEHVGKCFQTIQDFQIHVEESAHKMSTELSLEAMLEICRSSDPDPRRICPICHALFNKVEQLHNHIANHLERFAAFALPRDVETVEDDEMLKGSKDSSMGSHPDTVISLEVELLSTAKKLEMLDNIIHIIQRFHVRLDNTIPPARTDLLTRFIADHTQPFIRTLNHVQTYSNVITGVGNVGFHFHEAIRSHRRLKNLMDSVHIDELIADAQRLEDLAEPLDGAHNSFSQLLAVLQNVHDETRIVRAVYDFVPSEPGELAFKRGNLIVVIESTHKDWWRGTLGNQTGIFPLNHVEKLAPPGTDDLERDWELESEVFGHVKNAEKLMELCKTAGQAPLDTVSDIDWKEMADHHNLVSSSSPLLVDLIRKYSQRKDNLHLFNERLILAGRKYEELLDSSMTNPVEYPPPQVRPSRGNRPGGPFSGSDYRAEFDDILSLGAEYNNGGLDEELNMERERIFTHDGREVDPSDHVLLPHQARDVRPESQQRPARRQST